MYQIFAPDLTGEHTALARRLAEFKRPYVLVVER